MKTGGSAVQQNIIISPFHRAFIERILATAEHQRTQVTDFTRTNS